MTRPDRLENRPAARPEDAPVKVPDRPTPPRPDLRLGQEDRAVQPDDVVPTQQSFRAIKQLGIAAAAGPE